MRKIKNKARMKAKTNQIIHTVREGSIMRTLRILSFASALALTGCVTIYTGQGTYDDVYYSPNDPVLVRTEVKVKKAVPQDYAATETQPVSQAVSDVYENQQSPGTESYYSTDGSNTYITNNYYGGYYDYSYAARIRRFHRSYGFDSYYHDYYTNLYWYNYDPYFWGTSIYVGTGWYPSFHYGFGWRTSPWSYYYRWGYPSHYDTWGMFYWQRPYYWYDSYWMGYNTGFYSGYYSGLYNNWYGYNTSSWYINSRDRNSYYYGPRVSFAGNTGIGGREGNTRMTSFGERYERAIAAEQSGRSLNDNGRGTRIESPSSRPSRTVDLSTPQPATGEARGNRSLPSADQTPDDNRANPSTIDRFGGREGMNNEATRSGRTVGDAPSGIRENPATRQPEQGVSRPATPTQRYYQYETPAARQQQPQFNRSNETQEPSQQRQPQPYSSPRYTKPQSSEEYTNPAYRNNREFSRPAETTPVETRPAVRQQVTPRQSENPYRVEPPAPDNRRYTVPENRAPIRRSEGENNNSYSAPSRSPARSEPSYSEPRRESSPPPSRSNENYSSPPRTREDNSSSRSNNNYSAPSHSSPPASSSSGSHNESSRSSESGSRGGRF